MAARTNQWIDWKQLLNYITTVPGLLIIIIIKMINITTTQPTTVPLSAPPIINTSSLSPELRHYHLHHRRLTKTNSSYPAFKVLGLWPSLFTVFNFCYQFNYFYASNRSSWFIYVFTQNRISKRKLLYLFFEKN